MQPLHEFEEVVDDDFGLCEKNREKMRLVLLLSQKLHGTGLSASLDDLKSSNDFPQFPQVYSNNGIPIPIQHTLLIIYYLASFGNRHHL